MTTSYIPRITREDGDFLAEIDWIDGTGEYVGKQLVGWYDTHQRAYEAACKASTDAAQRDVADAAVAAHEAAQAADTPACRTCGGPVEIDGDDECSDCYALACERCGKPVSFEDASILGDEMVCAECYAAQVAHVAAMAELVAADERREYRVALEEAGSAADEAQRLAQFLQQAEDDEALIERIQDDRAFFVASGR